MHVGKEELCSRTGWLPRSLAVAAAAVMIGVCLAGTAQARPGQDVGRSTIRPAVSAGTMASPSAARPGVVTAGSPSSSKMVRAGASSAPCFQASFPTCSSSDPHVTFTITGGDVGCFYSITVNWGDTASTTKPVAGVAPGKVAATFTHTYGKPRTYMLSFVSTVTGGDCFGNSGTMEFTLTKVKTRVTPAWGFDTASPATTKFLTSRAIASLGNPKFVGQYLEYWKNVHDVVTANVAAAIRGRHAYVMLLSSPKTPGRNLTTAKEAKSDADLAVTAARKLHVPGGVAIFRDVENNYHITAAYIAAWVATVTAKGYAAGFYENPKESGSTAFSTAYCRAAHDNPAIPSRTVLFSDQPEVSTKTSKAESAAPPWKPASPSVSGCKSQTIAWQYLENPTKKAPNIDDDEALSSDFKYFW